MTIPVPKIKYNLLQDLNSSRTRRKCKITPFVLLNLLVLAVLCILMGIFYFLCYNESNEYEIFTNRAEIYSFDEFINKNSPCKFCDTPTNLSKQENRNEPLRLVCYYTIPNSEDVDILKPENIECKLCTHINIAFATIFNSTLIISEEMKDAIVKINSLKKCNKQLKILISIGGGVGDGGFPEMIINHASRKIFIKSVKSTLREFHLDGIDLDWEFPGIDSVYIKSYNESALHAQRQRQHFSQLLKEIRTEYIREKRDYILTVAVAAPEYIVDAAYDVEELNKYVDFISLMSYDFHFYTKYTPFTGFNAPLYNMKNETLYLSTLNINYTANMWISKGMDKNKIVIGLPTYGHSFSLVNSENVQPGSPANGFGKVGDLGFAIFPQICDFITKNPDAITVYNNETFSPYLYKDHEWISFENQKSILAKGNFIKDNKFGGAMIFSLNSDDHSGSCSVNFDEKFCLTRKLGDVILDNDL